jgi:membrane protein required for colicin V production
VNLLDFILVVIVGYSIVGGFLAGFARVGIGFAATLLGILFGLWFYRMPGAYLEEYLQSPAAANVLGFFIVFMVFAVSGALVAKILSRLFKWVGLSWLDRLLGAGAGFVRGMVLAVAVVTVVTAFAPNPPPRVIVDSKVMPYATAAGNVFAAMAPRQLKDGYRQSLGKLNDVWGRVKAQGKLGMIKEDSY